jgi:hypothetical protein
MARARSRPSWVDTVYGAASAQRQASRRAQPRKQDGAERRPRTDERGLASFEVTTPQHYQYEYRVGGLYKGPVRGGPDPGPGAIEISAEGDLDGDGVTSLVTLTLKVDPATKSLRLAEQPFTSPASVDTPEGAIMRQE